MTIDQFLWDCENLGYQDVMPYKCPEKNSLLTLKKDGSLELANTTYAQAFWSKYHIDDNFELKTSCQD